MSESKSLSPIVAEHIETLRKRIEKANRRIERHSRTEEVVEVGADENGKKTKSKKRVLSPEDKKLIERETAIAANLRDVIQQMQQTNAFVFEKPAQPKRPLSASALASLEGNATVAAGVQKPRYARKG